MYHIASRLTLTLNNNKPVEHESPTAALRCTSISHTMVCESGSNGQFNYDFQNE